MNATLIEARFTCKRGRNDIDSKLGYWIIDRRPERGNGPRLLSCWVRYRSDADRAVDAWNKHFNCGGRIVYS